MITHGNKQISEIVYARKASEGGGAVRLTNIIRGAQLVFGGLAPSFGWLTGATITAIFAAFGRTDGNAVIKATNVYLNAIAATDPTKATALAGFINEDPMFVCSLGLQPQGVTMPIRWLYNGGSAYIVTRLAISVADVEVGCRYMHVQNANNAHIWGSTQRGTNNFKLNPYGGKSFNLWTNGSSVPLSFTPQKDKITYFIVKATNSQIQLTVNGTTNTASKTSNLVGGVPFAFYHVYNIGGYNPVNGKIANWYFKEEGVLKEDYVPIKRNGVFEWIDLVSGELGTRVGTFTESYTLPDGTPWTPLTQTP